MAMQNTGLDVKINRFHFLFIVHNMKCHHMHYGHTANVEYMLSNTYIISGWILDQVKGINSDQSHKTV